MKIIAIAAVSRNGVIGKTNQKGVGELPWHIPEDLQFFKSSTLNQVVVMGRKSYDSLGKALPKRDNVVITRDHNWRASGVWVFHDLKSAIDDFKNKIKSKNEKKNIFIIGGAEVYKLALAWVDEVWLTEIETEYEGDAYFPEFNHGRWENDLFFEVERVSKNDGNHAYSFVKYARKS